MHHKGHIGEDPRQDEDNTSFMAMGRASNEPTSPCPDSDQENVAPGTGTDNGDNLNLTEIDTAATASARGVDTGGEDEDTNLDEHLRESVLEGRILPDPEETAALKKNNSVELTQQRGGGAVHGWTPTANHCMYWGTAITPGPLGITPMKHHPRISGGYQWGNSAHLHAPGLAPPNHPAPSVPYPPLNPAEALRRSQMVVDEITCHCDILAKIMQDFRGETMAHEARVRAHMERMEHSPIHRLES